MAAVAGLLVVAPVLLLPSLAWGAGDLERSSYPSDWETVAELVGAEPDPVTVVLPWAGSYRRFDWAADRAVLDPAPRYLPGEVLVDDRTYVDGSEIASEDPRVSAVQAALDAGSPEATGGALRALGVRWVLVEDQRVVDDDLPGGAGAEVAHSGPDLVLVDLGPDVVRSDTASGHSGQGVVVIAGHVCAFVLLMTASAYILRSRSHRSHI